MSEAYVSWKALIDRCMIQALTTKRMNLETGATSVESKCVSCTQNTESELVLEKNREKQVCCFLYLRRQLLRLEACTPLPSDERVRINYELAVYRMGNRFRSLLSLHGHQT